MVQEFTIANGDRRTTNYDHLVHRLGIDANPPAGLVAHAAGWDEQAGVFRIVALWNSADELRIFLRDQLGPLLAEGPVEPVERAKPELESIYELHHLAHGAG
jgi:hypothetical protein